MLDTVASTSITERLSNIAAGIRYEEIAPEAIDFAKRLIVDALACGVGGYLSPTGKIVQSWAGDMSRGTAEAALIGSGEKVSVSSAIIANQAMIRYLDYNDDLPIPIGPNNLVAAHPSGALPVALCLSEKTGASGCAVLESIVAGYEVVGRLLAGFRVSLEVRKFHHGTVLTYGGAVMAGKLLGLMPTEMAHAMGIAGSLTVGLDILDADGEEYTMTKNLADGMMSERGYTAAELARRGFTGPLRVIEGKKGFAQAVLGGDEMFEWDALGGGKADGRAWLLNTVIKALPAEATTHGHLTATTRLVNEHKITPDQIEKIIIRTNQRTVIHTGDPVKKYPRNKETADHSSYFLTAMAILHGRVTARIYNPENFTSARVRELTDKIELQHGPEFDAIIPAGQTTLILKDGRRFTKRIDKDGLVGEPTNRMNDAMLRAKFLECASGMLTDGEIDGIIEKVFSLEKADKAGSLISLVKIRAR